MAQEKDLERITEKIINLINACKRDVPKGFRLLNQRLPRNLNAALDLLLLLFAEEEKMIRAEHKKPYVTDDYERGVQRFAVELMRLLLPYHTQLKDNEKYKELCGKRHVAYGYYHIVNTKEYCGLAILNVWYQRTLYLGLAEFYNNFYGSFFDNEEAIELLCKFYPTEIKVGEYVHKISSALYQHVSNAGTPNDRGYAYQGIKLIEMYIGKLPEDVVSILLSEYTWYDILNNKVSRHQIFTIIDYARFLIDKKTKLKFWYLDSLVIADLINTFLLEKMEKERRNPKRYNYGYDNKLSDGQFIVFDKPFTFWNNDYTWDRVLFLDGKIVIGIALQDGKVKVYDGKKEQSWMFEYEYTDWLLEAYFAPRTSQRKQIRDLVFGADTDGETFHNSMIFSLAYLENYRGLQNQVIDFDHRFGYDDKKHMLLVKNIDMVDRIPHIYGKSVYSLSCIVGKNAAGKTSVVDFLREAFFKLLKFIEDGELVCVKGCVKEEKYKDYKILDEGAKFLVVFSLNETSYFLTNLSEMSGEGVKPFRRGIYRSINELCKVAYFSSQLRGDKMKLLLDNQEEAIYGEEKRQKQKLSKINNDLRQVDYSEEGSFVRKRKAIALAQNSQSIAGSFNKDICYQLSFLEKCSVKEICKYIDITKKKEFSLMSQMYGEIRETFRLEELKEDSIMEGLEEFIQLPDAVMGHFSAGQYAKFSFLAKLQWFLESNKEEIERYNKLTGDLVFSMEEVLLEGETALIFIDEGEIYYHPEWQRGYIKLLLEMINKKERKVQIVVTTNSPFIISDIQNEDITYLPENDGKMEGRKNEGTLGQNIHKLLRDNFFMHYTIGEYARELIENIMICLQEGTEQEKIDAVMRLYFDEIEDYYAAFHLLIEQIGEPVYKSQLKKMLGESAFAKQRDVEKQIVELEEEKRKLQEKIDKLKGTD